jgi:glycosyltransferase involved in cell wall biosynthesis
MKVLFSHYGMIDGAGFSRSLPIANGLADIGYEVILITCQDKGFRLPFKREKRGNLIIISFPEFLPKSFRKAGLGLSSILFKVIYASFTRFDIVHSDSGNRPSSGLPCVINRMIYKSVYISEWWEFFGKGGLYDTMPKGRRFFWGNYDNWAEIHDKKTADGVISLTEFTKNRALKLGIREEKLTVIYGGSDITNIKCVDNTNFRRKFGIDENCLLFGFVGANDTEIKDQVPFIQAIQAIKKDYNVKWFTTGAKLSEKILSQYNIEDDLYEFGWIDYKSYSEILSCADVFILFLHPDLHNKARFPNKLGDYLAAGRLIMTNGFGEVKYYVTNFPESFIITGWNSLDIQKTILELFHQKKLLVGKGLKSREVAEKFNSWGAKALEVNEFYNRILKRRGKKIMFTHFSLKKGDRWGRTFYLAKGLYNSGFDVVLLTSENSFNIFKIKKEVIDGVKVYSFPDILPARLISKGIGFISLFYKILFALFTKFNYVYSDAGEIPVCGWPCKINQLFYKSKYFSEWSDMLGIGGYYDTKPFWFKFFFGKFYLWTVKYFRRSADYVVVLTSYMQKYANSIGIDNSKIVIVPGGSMVKEIDYYPIGSNKNTIGLEKVDITFGYIGVNAKEIQDFLPIIEVIKNHKYKNKIKLLLFGHKISDEALNAMQVQDFVRQFGWIDFSEESIKLSAVDVFILFKPESTISNAGWPNKLGDYLAIGRPVLVKPYGDIIDFVNKFSDGFILITKDYNEIDQLISSIVEGRIDLKTMGEFNRRIALDYISWDSRSEILKNKIEEKLN